MPRTLAGCLALLWCAVAVAIGPAGQGGLDIVRVGARMSLRGGEVGYPKVEGGRDRILLPGARGLGRCVLNERKHGREDYKSDLRNPGEQKISELPGPPRGLDIGFYACVSLGVRPAMVGGSCCKDTFSSWCIPPGSASHLCDDLASLLPTHDRCARCESVMILSPTRPAGKNDSHAQFQLRR